VPVWEAPQAWLQQLVDQELLEVKDLHNLMRVNWPMCKAVLRCTQWLRFTMKVR
jgi:hypothetical protein